MGASSAAALVGRRTAVEERVTDGISETRVTRSHSGSIEVYTGMSESFSAPLHDRVVVEMVGHPNARLTDGPLGDQMLGEQSDWDEATWQERALCAQTDPEAFFPEKGGSTREAKRICSGCEVRSECLEYALAHDERFGIWGGLSERERRRLKRRVV